MGVASPEISQKKMASTYMWIAREITVKTARNFLLRTKNQLKCGMILESRQRNEEKGSPMKIRIEFYF